MTIIEQIKNEIERLNNKMDDRAPLAPNQKAGYLFALADILSILSDLEKSVKLNQDELENEIEKYREEHEFSIPAFQQVARHFAQWQKEQMMKEAVEYEVWDFSSSLEAYPHVNIPLDNKQYRSGDKVRVIVLPKECEK